MGFSQAWLLKALPKPHKSPINGAQEMKYDSANPGVKRVCQNSCQNPER